MVDHPDGPSVGDIDSGRRAPVPPIRDRQHLPDPKDSAVVDGRHVRIAVVVLRDGGRGGEHQRRHEHESLAHHRRLTGYCAAAGC